MTMSQQHPGQVRTVSEGVLRVLFGAFLAIVAIALVLYNAQWFAAVTVLMTLFAARERRFGALDSEAVA